MDKLSQVSDIPIFVHSEGINLKNPLCLLREKKCQELLMKLQSANYQHICLISAPPYSGKTSTITLLEAYLKKNVSNVVVKRKNFATGFDFDMSIFKTNPEQPTYFLIDEVQKSYGQEEFRAQLKVFAGDITRGVSSNLYFILFAAFSYNPTATALATTAFNSTPFHPELKLGLPFLRFTETEMDELFKKFEIDSNCMLPTSVKDYIYNFLSNHPGLTVLYLRYVKTYLLMDAAVTRDVTEEVSGVEFFFCSFMFF
jgi:hypothetical protein